MTDKRFQFRRAALAALATGALALAATAGVAADSKSMVDTAKAQGTVGEQADGFLGFVRPIQDAALQSAVAEINAGRAEVYRETASKTGVDPVAAGQATAQQLFSRMPSGQYYKPLGGDWTRK